MKLVTTLVLLCAATTASANPFPDGDAKTGQNLFQQFNCNRCHAKLVGGEGDAIFTRKNRKVHNAADLLAQLDACSGSIDVALSPQEKQHLGTYLNRYYNLK